MKIDVYTDGSTKNNGRSNAVGGWGFVGIINGMDNYVCGSGAEADTTNQRMELQAAINGLEAVLYLPFEEIEVFSDSAYLINCYKQKWYVNWQKNGWVNSKKQPVANQDLWEKLIPHFNNPRISWSKVAGHAGNHWNEFVDGLAQGAAAEYIKEYK